MLLFLFFIFLLLSLFTDAILCGEKFKNNKGNITSPGYPSGYDDKSYCVWEIEVSEGRSISLSFPYIDIGDFGNCSSGYVEVRFNFRKRCIAYVS